MRGNLKLAIGFAVLAMAAMAISLVVTKARAHPTGLSLKFERYSALDAYVADGEVAFFWLTNASDKTYGLAMTGNTNTMLNDPTYMGFGRLQQSWMVNCEFSDESPAGTNHWSQMATPLQARVQYLPLSPHSSIRLRVPVAPLGQQRRVAALCLELPPYHPAPAWATKPGFPALLYWRAQRLSMWFKTRKGLLAVWSDHPLSQAEAKPARRK